nr:GNAT family N-acetyltransferase [Salicibibacter cibarius]
MGTWIGYSFWGIGINEEAKKLILSYAFNELKLNRVFAGSKKRNVRSIKALEKLPYMRLKVEKEFSLEHKKIQEEYGTLCVLNVIEKNDFIQWLEN